VLTIHKHNRNQAPKILLFINVSSHREQGQGQGHQSYVVLQKRNTTFNLTTILSFFFTSKRSFLDLSLPLLNPSLRAKRVVVSKVFLAFISTLSKLFLALFEINEGNPAMLCLILVWKVWIVRSSADVLARGFSHDLDQQIRKKKEKKKKKKQTKK
jgi:hypothetical protein